MEQLDIQFADFWDGFVPEKSYFWDLLSKKYRLRLSSDPDILIYTSFGRSHLNYKCLKIFWTGENVRPDFGKCDFAFTFDEQSHGGKNYRLPLYVYYAHDYGYRDLGCITNVGKDGALPGGAVTSRPAKFCNMVISNANRDPRALEFFHKLSAYKVVDSGGRYLNNVGGPVDNKVEFIGNYKFTLAFENTSFPGYTTEKIFEPMLAASIPVYWGNPQIAKEFNPKSFINVHDYPSFDHAVRRIIEIDQDDELYRSILSEPNFHGDRIPEKLTNEAILERFSPIIDQRDRIKCVCRTWKHYPPYLMGRLKDVRVALLRLRSGLT